MELYPHQQKAVDELSNGKILWGGVGTGKSMVAVAYYMKVEADADVYVITTAKKRDSMEWQTEFARVGVGQHLNATIAGQLTVDSWNNIGKYSDVRDAFFIFDEQRLVGSGDWTDKFLQIAKHNKWVMLSATPGDTWLDYVPVFIANGFYKNRTEFKRRHVVYNSFAKFPKVDRYVEVGVLVRARNSILVEMPYMRTTTRHVEPILVEHDAELLRKAVEERWHVYENRPLRDVAELFLVMRKVVNSDASRLKAVRSLLTRYPRLIVFYNFDYELLELRKLSEEIATSEGRTECENTTSTETGTKTKTEGRSCSVSITNETTVDGLKSTHSTTPSIQIAEWNGHKHEEIPRSERWVYLVQYAAGAEGWNCISTNAMCFYSLTYSYKMWHQAYGRIDRLNTGYSDLYYHPLMSKTNIDFAIAKALKEKQNFNEKKFVEKL